MPYKFRYEVTTEGEITSRNDGSGCVNHQIKAQSLEVDEQGEPIIPDNWLYVPARNDTFVVPATGMQAALASGTPSEKVRAYKNLLVASKGNAAIPILGWDEAEMTEMLNNNTLAVTAHQELLDFLDTFGPNGDFPLHFQLDL